MALCTFSPMNKKNVIYEKSRLKSIISLDKKKLGSKLRAGLIIVKTATNKELLADNNFNKTSPVYIYVFLKSLVKRISDQAIAYPFSPGQPRCSSIVISKKKRSKSVTVDIIP